MRVFRDVEENGTIVAKPIFDIIECTYSGKDMGERSIIATFHFPSPVEFKIGDYVELQMHELLRDGSLAGSIEHIERFYIYTMPTVKKTAKRNTHGKGFEHIVTFYPAQYELSLVQMRNLGDGTSNDLIYTGFDSFSFVGGAKALMERIMRVLDEAYGKGTWNYYIANEVDEESNDAIEMVTFSFSGNSVMDALIKLNDKEGINTTFFINNRTIYVGYKRAYFCRTINNATIDPDIATQTFNFQYGKTSHENVAINYGGLYEITKSVGKETPITKLFAYGASRNLNRYYCSDRIGTGRYVNRLMLPSFQNDGKTDFILSPEIDTYGIREGSKTFEEIYPSLRYVTYGDIRQVKYCIKIKASGITGDSIEGSAYPVARVQCYRVIESETKGVNTIVEAAPPEDLAIYVRALDKVVKVVLCGGATDQEAISKQIAKDGKWGNGNGRVPAKSYQGNEYIPGSCFLVHDMGFPDTHLEHKTTDRSVWFTNQNDESAMGAFSEEIQTEIKLHQINYTDDFWLTDLYVFTAYNQTYFNRLGYSAYSYPVLNSNYTSRGGDVAHDSVLVNEIIEVEPITIDDTSAGIGGVDKLQQTFDVYLRDIGFKIDEQNDFGNMVFVLNGALKVSFLDGNLVGREFECKFQNDAQSYCVCAYNEDGTINNAFFDDLEYSDRSVPLRAFDNGAIWRLRLERINLDEPDYSNLNLIMPNTIVNAKGGDHVVLLDLFMPDIYVHAAENRLLREALHYLAANDRGKIQYAVAFDKVRMQQIPAYALQMREGLKIRMVDSDLEISTKNRVQKLFEGSLLTRTSLYETTYDSQPAEGYYYTFAHRDYYYLKDKGVVQFMGGNFSEYLKSGDSVFYIKLQSDLSYRGTCYIPEISREDIDNNGELFAKNGKVIMRCFEKVTTTNGTFYKETNEYRTFSVSNVRRTANGRYIGDVYISPYVGNIFKRSDYNSKTGEYEIHGIVEYDVRFTHKYDYTMYTPNTHLKPQGDEVYAPSKVLLEFSQNKHYDITIVAKNTNLLRTDTSGNPKLVLLNNLSGDAKMYAPADIALTQENIDNNSIRFTFSFDLNSSFNDTQDYYPALIYVSNNINEYVETVIESVVESDVAGNADLDYAEFTIQDVTIKITDSSNRTFAQPIKEISATLSEQNNASAWGMLMNRIEKTEIEGGENNKISQTIIISARRHYQQLLNLRNSIFDPDGTCNDTFLQVMMLQVGADSMNYYLDNTRQDANGTPHNYSIAVEDDGLFHFRVYNEDRLHHIVYTEYGGTWKHIGGNVDFTLNPNEDGTYPTYFVAIKCKQFSDEGEWVCEPIQHKVNEEEGFYYFNWGILSADRTGVYTLVETRGNAYMYGDNLIAGRISSIAKNSWFDLTKGEFVLGDNGDGTAALKYVNGVLTIGGLPNEKDIDDILERLDAVEQMEICGENLCIFDKGQFISDVKFDNAGYDLSYETLTYNYLDYNGNIAYSYLKAGKYIFSAEKMYFYILGSNGAPSSLSRIELTLQAITSDGDIHREVAIENGLDIQIKIETEVECYFRIKRYYTFNSSERLTINMLGVMLQSGTKATSYQPYVEHITSALKGTTDIAGGLVMTQALMLKNENNVVTAGMSGIEDDNILVFGGSTYKEAVNAAKADNDFHVGENKTGRQITSLIKKDGQGKIGIFKISDTQAVVKTKDGCSITIDANTGEIDVKDEKGIERTRITSKSLNEVIQIEIEENERFLLYHKNGYPLPYNEEFRYDEGQDLVYFVGVNKMTILHYFTVADTASITLAVKINYYSALGGFREGYEGRFRLIVEEDEGRTETKYIDLGDWWDLESVRTDYSDYEIAKPAFIDQEMSFAFGLPRGEYTVYGIFEVRDKATGSTDLSDIDIDITTYLKPAGDGVNLIEKDYPHTILANDGMFSHKNSSQYFKIINSGERQKIYAKGLSDGADREAGSGELYVTSSFVDAFVSFLDEFHAYVDHVRTIGSNAGNADAMQKKIEGIKNTLIDASGNRITDIIASS